MTTLAHTAIQRFRSERLLLMKLLFLDGHLSIVTQVKATTRWLRHTPSQLERVMLFEARMRMTRRRMGMKSERTSRTQMHALPRI
jgi:hypothetical protein